MLHAFSLVQRAGQFACLAGDIEHFLCPCAILDDTLTPKNPYLKERFLVKLFDESQPVGELHLC